MITSRIISLIITTFNLCIELDANKIIFRKVWGTSYATPLYIHTQQTRILFVLGYG